jgi:class 3 adenylate cyclase
LERGLAAILATNGVGYSRLMELDEVGTLTVLKAHRRALVDSAITKHRGRIIRLMGDGALVELASVVDVVTCTVASRLEISRATVTGSATGRRDVACSPHPACRRGVGVAAGVF